MVDSVDSQSEKINSELLSRLANDDYLLSKIVSMRRHRKLSQDEINYIIKCSEQKTDSDSEINLDEFINWAVNSVICECENNNGNESKHEKFDEDIDFTEKVSRIELTVENFEDFFGLKELKAVELPCSSDENIRSIRYKDNNGITHAIAQINTDSNRIRLQTFGDILPKQEFINPQQANYKVMSKSKANGWTAEYGGVNQFDGSLEIRYKDVSGHVMAAVIFKSDGNVDTVVEYQYQNDKKIQMLHTSQYGHSKTIYDDVTDVTKLIIDIDTDGNICCITKGLKV